MRVETRAVAAASSVRARKALLRFWRDEGGTITHFVLVVFILMLAVAGMGVDVMRHEENRAMVQSTLDRAVLASASLRQTTDEAGAEAIVRDYFVKSGVDATLQNVTADIAINSRDVSATAQGRLQTIFLNWLGVYSLPVRASSTANESTQDIEIVLVLDVSWSMEMNGSTRLANLKTAAKEFIDLVLANNPERRVSVAIVPFNAQVNLGPNLFSAVNDYYNVTDESPRAQAASSYCIDLPDRAFDQRTIPAGLALPQAGHIDAIGGMAATNNRWETPLPFGTATRNNLGSTDTPRLVPVCRTATGNMVQLPHWDRTVVRNRIDGLVAGGYTSIYLGMKWGLMMVDPSFRPVLQRAGLPADLADRTDRPFDYARPNTRKIIILMTDGDHQGSHRLRDGFRSGDSPIWRRNGTSEYSILVDRRLTSQNSTERCLPFWVPSTGTNGQGAFHNRPWNGSTSGATTGCYSAAAAVTGATRQRWDEVWADLRMNWVAYHLYARPACGVDTTNAQQPCRTSAYRQAQGTLRGPTQFLADNVTVTSTLGNGAASDTPWITDPMDGLLQRSCTQAINQGIILYGIAYDLNAASDGYRAIYNCVSDEGRRQGNFFYPAQGLDIVGVFRSIATQINALRLRL